MKVTLESVPQEPTSTKQWV